MRYLFSRATPGVQRFLGAVRRALSSIPQNWVSATRRPRTGAGKRSASALTADDEILVSVTVPAGTETTDDTKAHLLDMLAGLKDDATMADFGIASTEPLGRTVGTETNVVDASEAIELFDSPGAKDYSIGAAGEAGVKTNGDKSDDNSSVPAAIIAAVCALVVAVGVAALVVNRRRSARGDAGPTHHSVGTPGMQMRLADVDKDLCTDLDDGGNVVALQKEDSSAQQLTHQSTGSGVNVGRGRAPTNAGEASAQVHSI